MFVLSDGFSIKVHDEGRCIGEVCPIHRPTDHHMREWPMVYRGDRGIFERLCPDHGTGHPDPDDQVALKFILGESDGIHGCDGCCNPEGKEAFFASLEANEELAPKVKPTYTYVDFDTELPTL
jgi:hypothetical protein